MDLMEQLNEQKRKVDFNSYDISVKELISMVSESIIDIAPEYQRQFRWPNDKRSSLIESVLLGIPLPNLFMATNPDGSWELIDGVQRLSSIIQFAGSESARQKINVEDELKLVHLQKLNLFNNLKFSELPKSVQLDFLLKPLKITTLTDKSDLEVRFDLFERLNTGGVALTNQEIRSCVYRGKFNDFIKSLCNDDNFKNVVKLTRTQEDDGTREEFVLRFFAFFYNYENFDHSVVDFLNNFMASAVKSFNYKEGEEIFIKTFRELSNLPNGITRGRTTTPTNLFEGVSVGAALALGEVLHLNLNNAQDWIESDELKVYTTGATNSKAKVLQRINFCKDKFVG
ncbi:MAG: DUF262 domain-containing protein [Pedobacter sp.]|uniref:DUF262 domain-containing protein n=1 Tax=Pedobacter sp. TaxID=1411316 RepID=UPI00356633C8